MFNFFSRVFQVLFLVKMGVRGLTLFVKEREFIKEHKLSNCMVIIDGLNLVNTIYFRSQNNKQDSMFGGDYGLFVLRIHQFFNHLKACNITPLVINDGTYDPSLNKFDTMLKRGVQQLNIAYKIYKTNHSGEQILPFYAIEVFELVLKQMGVLVKRCLYEADPIILQLVKKLDCIVVTNDGDFFLENVSKGIVLLDSLVDNCNVLLDKETSTKYLKCSIYKIEHMQSIFRFTNFEVVFAAGFILGNDFSDLNTCQKIIARLPPVSSHKNRRQRQIYNALKWIAQFQTIESLFKALAKILKTEEDPLFDAIRQGIVSSVEGAVVDVTNAEQLEQYVVALLQNSPQFVDPPAPEKIITRHINLELPCKVLSILNTHLDWCRPLAEDFSIENCFVTSFALSDHIYALLRTTNTDIPKIKRYSRKDANFWKELIRPEPLMDDLSMLPKCIDLSTLKEAKKVALFYQITKLPTSLYDKIRSIFVDFPYDDAFQVNEDVLGYVVSMFVSLIYMLNSFPNEMWLEFIYAIAFSIFTIGNNSSHKLCGLFSIDKVKFPKFDEVLIPFNSVPVFTHSLIYVPRVVHLFNVFQTVHFGQTMLVEILSINESLNYKVRPFPLNGTFIYNLTLDLARRPKPYLYLQQLLGRATFKGTELFDNLMKFLLNHCERRFCSHKDIDKDIIPESLIEKYCDRKAPTNQPAHKYIFRAFEVTKRNTHIQSQKHKLRK